MMTTEDTKKEARRFMTLIKEGCDELAYHILEADTLETDVDLLLHESAVLQGLLAELDGVLTKLAVEED